VNDDELGAIVDYAWSRGITPRFIELMPIGEGAALSTDRFVPFDRMRRSLATLVLDERGLADDHAGPARYLSARDGSGRRVGFITATSDDFCGTCNRVRITSHGELRGCLADRAAVSLRDAMRAAASDADLAWSIAWALGAKGAGHEFTTSATEHTHVGMSLVGG
jgi:cyclic pyranopterin phosphate synthase